MEVSGQLLSLVTLLWGRNCGACLIGSWVVPRASVDIVEKRNPLLLPRFKHQTVQPIA